MDMKWVDRLELGMAVMWLDLLWDLVMVAQMVDWMGLVKAEWLSDAEMALKWLELR